MRFMRTITLYKQYVIPFEIGGLFLYLILLCCPKIGQSSEKEIIRKRLFDIVEVGKSGFM